MRNGGSPVLIFESKRRVVLKGWNGVSKRLQSGWFSIAGSKVTPAVVGWPVAIWVKSRESGGNSTAMGVAFKQGPTWPGGCLVGQHVFIHGRTDTLVMSSSSNQKMVQSDVI